MTRANPMRFPATLLSLLLLPAAHAQTPAPTPATPHYDVASVKPNHSINEPTYWRTTSDGFTASNMTIMMLLTSAYNTREGLISGLPGWAQQAHFDINAKLLDAEPEALKKLSDPQRDAMLAELLADRFQLKIHPEIKQLAVYDLVLATGGSKLKPNAAFYEANPSKPYEEGKAPGGFFTNTGEFTGVAVPLSTLTSNLEGELQRNIIDRTGLAANYDIHLKWTPERAADANAVTNTDSGKSAVPPLFTAIQEQLGLKLVSAKGPVQTWVVDHIERPTEN